jgi:hypothetical protein
MATFELQIWAFRGSGRQIIPRIQAEHLVIWLQKWCADRITAWLSTTLLLVSSPTSLWWVKDHTWARTVRKYEMPFFHNKSAWRKVICLKDGPWRQQILSTRHCRGSQQIDLDWMGQTKSKLTYGWTRLIGKELLINESKHHSNLKSGRQWHLKVWRKSKTSST